MEKKVIINLLKEAFDDGSLKEFCYANFEEVESGFAEGHSKIDKIISLIKYCEQRDKISMLKELIKAERPELYAKHISNSSSDRSTQPDFNQEHLKLYNYFVAFPPYRDMILNYFIPKKRKGFNDSVLFVYGSSRETSKLAHYEWFARHILRKNITLDSDKLAPDVSKLHFTSIGINDASRIAYDFLVYLKAEEFTKTLTTQKIKDELESIIYKKIIELDTSLILSYKLIDDNNPYTLKTLSDFINDFWIPITSNLKADSKIMEKKHSLILLVLMEEKRLIDGEEIIKPKVNFTPNSELIFEPYHNSQDKPNSNQIGIQIKALGEDKLNTCYWLQDYNGYFTQYNKLEICNISNEQLEALLPECQTLEGFFEKLTPMVLDNLSFSDFISKIHD